MLLLAKGLANGSVLRSALDLRKGDEGGDGSGVGRRPPIEGDRRVDMDLAYCGVPDTCMEGSCEM